MSEQTQTKTPVARASLGRLLKLLRPLQGKYLLALVLRVALTTTERMMVAYLAKVVIDEMTAGNESAFYRSLLGWIAFYLGYVIVAPFLLYLWNSTLVQVTANLREQVFRHLNRLPLGYHEAHHSGDALSVLTNDVSAADKAYQADLLTLAEASAQGLAAAVFMLLLNWQLALVVMLSSVLPLIINALFAGPLRQIGQQVQENLGGLSERMTDLLAGFQVVRTFNLGEWILERFERANGRVLASSLRRVQTEAALAGANEFGGMFAVIPLIVGGYLVMRGQTTFGILVGLIQLSNQVSTFAFSLGGTLSRIQAALAATDRMVALLDTPLEPQQYGPAAAPAFSASATGDLIAFDAVGFGYADQHNILNGLSFGARAGQVVAFAGPSGGGKSTILKLLLGGYPVTQGAIRVNGRAINATPLAELRDQFAYVPQDAYLFAGTIYENIRCGKPQASEAEIIAAARSAFAHDFIMEFPAGYQTVVGERGARLSGGQRQRIAIARALLKDAPILLLDEATSALDSESEQVVQQALEALMQGRTTLVVAHRLSTILHADKICVIEGGQVVEQGRHAELLARHGLYANLFAMQKV